MARANSVSVLGHVRPLGYRSCQSVEGVRSRCQCRGPVSRDTIQIRLAQPPLYLMGAVVIASLLPLFAGAASDSVERLRRFAFAGISAQQLEPPAPAAALVVEDDEPEEDEAPVLVVEPEPVEQEPVAAPVKTSRPRRKASTSPQAKAVAACQRDDKDAARAVYKSLERGDPQRKQIRKSCRKSGIWIF